MSTTRKAVNVEKGKQGFQETPKAAPTSASLGEPGLGDDIAPIGVLDDAEHAAVRALIIRKRESADLAEARLAQAELDRVTDVMFSELGGEQNVVIRIGPDVDPGGNRPARISTDSVDVHSTIGDRSALWSASDEVLHSGLSEGTINRVIGDHRAQRTTDLRLRHVPGAHQTFLEAKRAADKERRDLYVAERSKVSHDLMSNGIRHATFAHSRYVAPESGTGEGQMQWKPELVVGRDGQPRTVSNFQVTSADQNTIERVLDENFSDSSKRLMANEPDIAMYVTYDDVRGHLRDA